MKFKASIFTLNKDEQIKFEKHFNGECEQSELTAKEIAKEFAEQIWKAKVLQDKWAKNGGSSRALGLAKGHKMVFYMEVEGKQFLKTETNEATRLKICLSDNTLAKLRKFIELFFEYTLEG